jgi:hypothetical protein
MKISIIRFVLFSFYTFFLPPIYQSAPIFLFIAVYVAIAIVFERNKSLNR